MQRIIDIILEAAKKQGLSLLLSLGFAFLFFQQVSDLRKEQQECMREYLEYLRQDHVLMIKAIENNTMVMEGLKREYQD